MKQGQGYAAHYHEYRLHVELWDGGWRARIYHMPSREWVREENVSGPTVGKDAAITLAVLAENPKATRDLIIAAKAYLKWEYYEP